MDQPPDPGYIQLLLIHKCPPYPQAAGFSFLPGYPGHIGQQADHFQHLQVLAAGIADTLLRV